MAGSTTLSTTLPYRRLRLVIVLTAAGLLAVAVVLLSGLGGPRVVLLVDDLAQLFAAAAAATTAAVRARRSQGGLRRSWAALAAGCGAWAAGQTVWSWYQLVLEQESPFPSLADLGFLGFPIGAGLALALYPAGDALGERRRRLLDGLTVAAALTLVSWTTALGAVVGEGAEGALSLVVSVAYPVGDVVVLTVVVLLLSRATADRVALGLLGAGIAGIAVSDSAFLYLNATGSYGSDSHAVSLGWCAGFALLALAPLMLGRSSAHEDDQKQAAVDRPTTATGTSFLPYVPVVVSAVVVGEQILVGQQTGPVDLLLGALIVALVLYRQYATVLDNIRLVGELAAREAQLRHQAFHDGLTGLANRALFQDRVEHALELHRRDLRPLAVLFCDLDDFKLVNDTLGHATGDALLVRVGERLQGALRSGDTLARLGGDEFAVLLEDSGEPLSVAQKVAEVLRPTFTIAGRALTVHASVGVTTVGPDMRTPTAATLLAQADTAMYAAKRGGKGALRCFELGMELEEVADSGLAQALDAAARTGQLYLAYQPIVDLVTGRVQSVEALARWKRGSEQVPPSTFIPLAERTGLIGPLTARVLDLACAQAAVWAAGLGPSPLRVGVNLSPQSVTDRAFPQQVADCLARHGLDGRALTLDVTESGLLSDPEAAREVCVELRAMGVHLSLDDFGVGFSSLAHLNRLPLDSLKLDRAFLADLGRDDEQTRFIRAVLRLATDLGLDVVAEGVERPEQLEHLLKLGCAYAQGYLLARPGPAAELTPQLGCPVLIRKTALQ